MICRNPVLSFSKHSPFCLNLYPSHVSGRRRGPEISRFASTRFLPSQDTVNEPKLPRFIRRQHLQEGSSIKHPQQITRKTRAQSASFSPRVPPTHRSRHYGLSQDTVNEPRFIRRQHPQGSSMKDAQQIHSETRAQSASFSPRMPTHRSRHYDPSQDTINEPRFIRRQHLQDSSMKHAQQIHSETRAQSASFSPRVPPTHRSRRYDSSQDTVNEPKLPRFIRRQHLQEGSSMMHALQITSETRAQSVSLSPRVPPTHRSRHYDPSNEVPKANIRLLEPHVLSKRLKTLCDSNKVDEAVHMLKNTPLDAQNTQVWNTLMWEALKAKRFKLSYQLFIDVSIFKSFFLLISKLIFWHEIDETARAQSHDKNFSDLLQWFISNRGLVDPSQTTCKRTIIIRRIPTSYIINKKI